MTSFNPGDRVMYTGSASKIKGKIGCVESASRYTALVDFGNDQSGIVALSNLRPAWQECKDCDGHASAPCPTCEGTGRINRTGPYKLHSGEWSDDVDRNTMVSARAFTSKRWEVIKLRSVPSEWAAYRGLGNGTEFFSTFEEAIAYAHEKAKGDEK